ncbi:alpha/beta hydrolase [Halosimplex sp. TS25]|uniref:alpha/beta hydrolase n=1 Tax=Halosimplex rarum TaxID=3396619 RepID=UPI0039E80466
MSTASVTLEVGDDTYPGRLNEPENPTERGVLILPGMGHGPFGDVFDRFAEAAADRGLLVARFETWTGQDDLAEKSEADMQRELDAQIEFLRERDCELVSVVAKSFGGRLALTHLSTEHVARMVLWAPAVFFGEYDDRPTITVDELADVEPPTLILQGDADEGLSVENARDLAEHLPEGAVVELPGEDHSFRNDQSRIVDETLDSLSS